MTRGVGPHGTRARGPRQTTPQFSVGAPSELVDVVPVAFIHCGFAHVAANSVPLLVMGFLAALGGLRRFAALSLVIIVADGLGVWLIAPAHTNTAGASGLILGLFGYRVTR